MRPHATTTSDNGYSRWPFFEYLSREVRAVVREATSSPRASQAARPHRDGAVSAALAAKGTTLADTYNAWARAEVIVGYSIASLKA